MYNDSKASANRPFSSSTLPKVLKQPASKKGERANLRWLGIQPELRIHTASSRCGLGFSSDLTESFAFLSTLDLGMIQITVIFVSPDFQMTQIIPSSADSDFG